MCEIRGDPPGDNICTWAQASGRTDSRLGQSAPRGVGLKVQPAHYGQSPVQKQSLVLAVVAEAEIASLPWERKRASLGQFSLVFKTAATCQNQCPQS